MENSESGTLKPCLNPTLKFPPHRRRPLQSQTYRMFVRIMSHCSALQSPIEPRSRDGEGGGKLAEVSGHGNGGDKLGEMGELMVNENSTELESSLVLQMSSPDGAKANVALEEDIGSVISNEVNLSHVVDTSKQGNEEVTAVNSLNHMNSSIESCPYNVVENHNQLSPGMVQTVVDRPSVNESYEAVNPPTSTEEIADVPKPVGNGNKSSPSSVVNFSEGMEHALQLKQRELEKLISASANLDFTGCDFSNEGIEEGEISGGDGFNDRALDLLMEDVVSLEEKKVDDGLVSEMNERELVNDDNGDGQQGKYNIKSSPQLDENEGGNGIMKLVRSNREEQKASGKICRDNVSSNCADDRDSILEAERMVEQVGGVKDYHSVISSENFTQREQITYEDITDNNGSATAVKEACGGKRKRGPLTNERKAKKKRKDRIKRAEKNKKLGVRRLKLQPVLKPKKVVYCRHYLAGRCQEGEKCKFSHDTTPLTKSTPCSFLARNSCMKGDDCPFDHELSKYPCNNFVSKGFCSRGADCLFKHEVSSTNDPSLISKLSKTELKSPSPTSNSNSNQLNKAGLADQHFRPKCSPLVHSTGKLSQNQLPKNLESSVEHVPKGVCIISHVRPPTGNTAKHEEGAPSPKVDNCVKISSSQSDNINKSNETVKGGVPLRPPKGINFLSFGKRPLGDSANKEKGASGSLLDQSTKNALVGYEQTGPGVNKMANEVSIPRGIKFLSGGSGPVDEASDLRQLSIGIGSDSVSSVPADRQEKQNAVDGVKFSSRTPNDSPSSSHPLWQSLSQGAWNCGGNPSTASVQRSLQSTLAFAAKIDSDIRLDRPIGNPFDVTRHDSSTFK